MAHRPPTRHDPATLAARLELLAAKSWPRRVRRTAALPIPPAGQPIAPIDGPPRLVLFSAGRRDTTFAADGRIEQWTMGPGDALLARANTWMASVHRARFRLVALHLADEAIQVMWRRFDGPATGLVTEAWCSVPLAENEALRQTARALLAVADAEAQPEATRLLACALLRLTAAAMARPARDGSQAADTWRSVREYVHDQCDQPIDRASTAAALGLSPNYLSRLCRLRSGRTFIAFLNRARAERAAALLERGDLTVAEIAARCGFGSVSYFIRRFRIAYGTTPGTHRRRTAWRRTRRAARPARP
jgi:AraC-like DNA-binding protein